MKPSFAGPIRLLGVFHLLPLLLACSALACPSRSEDEAVAPNDPALEAPKKSGDPSFVENIPAIPVGARNIQVTVNSRGYLPPTIEGAPNETIVLEFTRITEAECGRYVIIEGSDTRAELPLKETVRVPVTLPASGELSFVCGMKMMRGVVKVVSLPTKATPAEK